MIAKAYCGKIVGGSTAIVTVEADVRKDGVGVHLDGLASKQTKEVLLRTITALQSAGYRFPGKKVTISIKPSDLTVQTEGYDLAMALAILKASGQEPLSGLENCLVVGELGLDGSVRTVEGSENYRLAALHNGMHGGLLEAKNLKEADALKVEILKKTCETFEIVDNTDKGLELALYDAQWNRSEYEIRDFSREHPDLRIRYDCEYEEMPESIWIFEDGHIIEDLSPLIIYPSADARFTYALLDGEIGEVRIGTVLKSTFAEWAEHEGLADDEENFGEFVRREVAGENDQWLILNTPRSIHQTTH